MQTWKDPCHLLPRPNNSFALYLQEYYSEPTVIRFSVETLVLLPSPLVFPTRPMWGSNHETAGTEFHRGWALPVSSQPQKWWGCPSTAVSLTLPQKAAPFFKGSVRLLSPHGSVTTSTAGNSLTNNQVLVICAALLAAMCAHSPGYSYTSRTKRPEQKGN